MKRIFYTITFLILLCSLCTLFSGCKDNQDNLDNKIPGNDISADSADGAVVPAQDEPVIEEQPIDNQPLDRLNKIPSDAVKMTPETDAAPPKSYSQDYYDPMPLKGMINSAGAEDSAFMMPDGNTIYFFFTPDVRIPAEKQVIDGVTGIYTSKKQGNEWQRPQRVILQDKGKLALDGCEFVLGNKMWFCTAREGYTGIHWATAEFRDGEWMDWNVDDFDPEYDIGELHITSDGNEIYYHSSRPGGKGGLDIWKIKKNENGWSQPENLAAVNSDRDDGWPALSPDGTELWISRDYGLWRSRNIDGEWEEPELMISPLAGEPTIDSRGNVYFTHHFFDGDNMIEADIYVAKKV